MTEASRRLSSEDRRLRLLGSALLACERSSKLIDECGAVLREHRSAVASLRTAAGGERPGTAPPDGGRAGRSLELDDEIVVGSLRLVPLRRTVSGGAGRVLLTPAEWQLLVVLVTHRARTLSRTALAGLAWGPGFAHRHGEVEVYVSRLRRKLARAGESACIQTVRGRGYRLDVGEAPEPEGDALTADQLGGGAA